MKNLINRALAAEKQLLFCVTLVVAMMLSACGAKANVVPAEVQAAITVLESVYQEREGEKALAESPYIGYKIEGHDIVFMYEFDEIKYGMTLLEKQRMLDEEDEIMDATYSDAFDRNIISLLLLLNEDDSYNIPRYESLRKYRYNIVRREIGKPSGESKDHFRYNYYDMPPASTIIQLLESISL